jgi:hypothetical protein
MDRLWPPHTTPTIRAIAHPARGAAPMPRLRDLRPLHAGEGGAAGACRVLLAVGPEGGWDVRSNAWGVWGGEAGGEGLVVLGPLCVLPTWVDSAYRTVMIS